MWKTKETLGSGLATESGEIENKTAWLDKLLNKQRNVQSEGRDQAQDRAEGRLTLGGCRPCIDTDVPGKARCTEDN